MTKEQESQQAQTIAEIKSDAELIKIMLDMSSNIPAPDKGEIRDFINGALEIVDHQAQKIAEQAKEIEKLKERIAGLHAHIDEFQAVK